MIIPLLKIYIIIILFLPFDLKISIKIHNNYPFKKYLKNKGYLIEINIIDDIFIIKHNI